MLLPTTLTSDLRIRDEDRRRKFERCLRKLNKGETKPENFMKYAHKMLHFLPVTWPKFLSLLPSDEAMAMASAIKITFAMPQKPKSTRLSASTKKCLLLAVDNMQFVVKHLPFASLIRLAATCKANSVNLQPYALECLKRTHEKFGQFVKEPPSSFTLFDADFKTMKVSRLARGVLRLNVEGMIYKSQSTNAASIFDSTKFFVSSISHSDITAVTIFKDLEEMTASSMWFKIGDHKGKTLYIYVFVVCGELFSRRMIEDSDNKWAKLRLECKSAK